jgi:arabinose-5-phosphate isomerase
MRLTEYMMGGKQLHEMPAGHLMERDAPYYHEDSSGHSLATAMVNGRCGSIPIVNDQKLLVGIVTEFDLLKALMKGADLTKVKAREMMSRSPISVSKDQTADKIIELMETHHLIHLPVIDNQKRLVGSIERGDVLLGYLESRLEPPKSF